MVWGGLQTDIMIPYNILGKPKLDRLMALARQTRITASADSAHTVRGYSTAALEWGVTLGVVVELECGHNRTGVATAADALALGKLIDSLPGLELRGIMGFPTPPAVRPFLQETIHAFERAGLPCPMSAAAVRPTLEAHLIPRVDRVPCGRVHRWRRAICVRAAIRWRNARCGCSPRWLAGQPRDGRFLTAAARR